ncbi:MAG: EF-P 5-aminopentanol modification-associated protein YfmH [Bacillota bacterium]
MKSEKIFNKTLKETLIKGTHPSGLEIYVLKKEGFNKKHGYFLTKYGSIHNTFETQDGKVFKKPAGIAHFLEHKIFEDEQEDNFEKFAMLGAKVNASTKFDSTTYKFYTVDNFYKSLDQLINLVQKPHITEKNVEKEKGIIEQEINMYLDNPDWKVYFNTLKALYHKNPIREDIAGSVESIEKITKEDLDFCYNQFYSPKNMIMFLIGDIDHNKVFKQVDNSLSDEYIKRSANPKVIIEKEPKTPKQKKVVEHMDVSQPKIAVGFKDVSINDYSKRETFKRGLALKIALTVLFGSSSEFYKKHYNSGLIDESFSADHSYNQHYIHSIIGGETDEPEKLYKVIIDYIDKSKVDGFDKKDFLRIKRKFIGRFIASFNSLQSIASLFTTYHMKGINSFDYLDILESIDYKYALDIFKNQLNTKNSVLSIVKNEGETK